MIKKDLKTGRRYENIGALSIKPFYRLGIVMGEEQARSLVQCFDGIQHTFFGILGRSLIDTVSELGRFNSII